MAVQMHWFVLKGGCGMFYVSSDVDKGILSKSLHYHDAKGFASRTEALEFKECMELRFPERWKVHG